MGVTVLFTMRTANRAPKKNYLGRTVRSLIRQGVPAEEIHLFPTDPAIAWMMPEVGEVPIVCCPPARRMTPNENGLRPIALLDTHPADWIILSEDDLEWCADPIGSIARWLEDHATPEHVMYRFFAFELGPKQGDAYLAPCKEQKGSQAVALRASDARRLAKWAAAHATTWRPPGAPFQNRPHDGFDKLLGYWALSEDHPTGLVSRPFFVRHLGVESSIHAYGRRMDKEFAGVEWSYRSAVLT